VNAATTDRARQFARRLQERWFDDPALFASEVLGVEAWSRQIDILRAVARYQRVAVRSGQKVSKSITLAIIALWWFCTRRDARVVLTSSSALQIKTILWDELRKLHSRARVPIGGTLNLDPRTGLVFPDGRQVLGISTDAPERMQGQSGANLLYLADEASGIDEAIFEAIFGNLAGGGRVVLTGNPTQTSGTFFDAFHSRSDFWYPLAISSEETPNAYGPGDPIPGLATREYIEERRREWGVDSSVYRVRIRGEFPSQGSNAVIAKALVDAAIDRWKASAPTSMLLRNRLELGVDPARFGGDRAVIFPVRGRFAFPPHVFAKLETRTLADHVMRIARTMRLPGEIPIVRVDTVGEGQGVFSLLALETEIEAQSVYVAEAPIRPGFTQLRDEVWWCLRDWLRDGGEIPRDASLETELVAPSYAFDRTGRIKVESKDDLKKRIRRSPDLADALALAVYRGIGSIAREILADKTPFPRARFAEDAPPTRRLAELDDDEDEDEGRGWREF
jgi:phage terminase large subunit